MSQAMMFKNIDSLLAWAFQMSETVLIKTQKFAEPTSVCHSELSMDERHKMATDILVKVSRLDRQDQVCIAAKHTLAAEAVHHAAYLLPNWPRPMQLALVRRWAGDTRYSQREIADMCGYSRQLVTIRDSEANKILNRHYWHGSDILEIQLLDILEDRLIHDKNKSA